MFFLFYIIEIRIWHVMQIVSNTDNLHEMSNPVFYEKYHQFVMSWISPESGND